MTARLQGAARQANSWATASVRLRVVIVALAVACLGSLGQSTALAAGGWSIPTPVDPGQALHSVSCASTSFCAAVDNDWRALTYNGSSWGAPVSIDSGSAPFQLESVSCPSESFCAAVDIEGNVLTYDGSSWSTPASIDSGGALVSVSCPSASFCAAVDYQGNAVTYDGSSWSVPASIDSGDNLFSVSCVSGTFCAAVDLQGNVLTYDGSSWSAPASIDSVRLLSVSCASEAFCAAVDLEGRVLTYNGSTWSAPASIDSGGELDSVSCPSTSFCIAVDGHGNAVTYNGTSWSAPVSIDSGGELDTVSCVSAAFCAAVDDHGNALFFPRTKQEEEAEEAALARRHQEEAEAIKRHEEEAAAAKRRQEELAAAAKTPGAGAPVSVTAPPPKLAVSANVATVSGSVRVKLPGSSTFVELTTVHQIPFGTIVDATHGSVSVTTAGPHGGTQTVTLSGGEFVLTQGRNGMVVATLTGGNFSVCPTARERAHVARAASKHATGKHVVRKLWAEGHGNFTTDGNYASASVRGTRWLTEDLCEGTLIHVATDRVAVVNRVNHRHIIVKAGHSYLAKAP